MTTMFLSEQGFLKMAINCILSECAGYVFSGIFYLKSIWFRTNQTINQVRANGRKWKVSKLQNIFYRSISVSTKWDFWYEIVNFFLQNFKIQNMTKKWTFSIQEPINFEAKKQHHCWYQFKMIIWRTFCHFKLLFSSIIYSHLVF